MSRLAWLLTALVALLIVVLWYFLLWSPTQQEIRDVEAETDIVEVNAAATRSRAAELRAVRDGAPEAAAELAGADVLIPRDAALPSLLRQLQQSADDAGVRLHQVSPGRPSVVEGDAMTVSEIQFTMALEGTYFQMVDFARRLEDPLLAGRGLVWGSASITRSDYPELNVSLAARVFSQGRIDAIEAPDDVVEAEPEEDEDAGDGDESEALEDDLEPEAP